MTQPPAPSQEGEIVARLRWMVSENGGIGVGLLIAGCAGGAIRCVKLSVAGRLLVGEGQQGDVIGLGGSVGEGGKGCVYA